MTTPLGIGARPAATHSVEHRLPHQHSKPASSRIVRPRWLHSSVRLWAPPPIGLTAPRSRKRPAAAALCDGEMRTSQRARARHASQRPSPGRVEGRASSATPCLAPSGGWRSAPSPSPAVGRARALSARRSRDPPRLAGGRCEDGRASTSAAVSSPRLEGCGPRRTVSVVLRFSVTCVGSGSPGSEGRTAEASSRGITGKQASLSARGALACLALSVVSLCGFCAKVWPRSLARSVQRASSSHHVGDGRLVDLCIFVRPYVGLSAARTSCCRASSGWSLDVAVVRASLRTLPTKTDLAVLAGRKWASLLGVRPWWMFRLSISDAQISA